MLGAYTHALNRFYNQLPPYNYHWGSSDWKGRGKREELSLSANARKKIKARLIITITSEVTSVFRGFGSPEIGSTG